VNAWEWQRFLQRQRDEHRKVVFMATELANASGQGLASIMVSLQRLIERGVIERYANGRYGLPGAATAMDLVPSLDPGAYVTGLYALHRHNLVTQVPVEIPCFTNRRHNRSRVRDTSLGRIVFMSVTGSIYLHPGPSALAGPVQALCDFVYLCCRRGLSAASQATFRNLEMMDRGEVKRALERYPATVARELAQCVD
jgi:hypothetical protein